MSGNTHKRRITFYTYNRETKVPELELLSTTAAALGVSLEDFVRGAALDTAAKIVIQEHMRKQATAEAAAKQAAEEKVNGEASIEETPAAATEEAGAGEGAAPDA